MSALCGLNRTNYLRREYQKRVYTLRELVGLQRVSDLTWLEMGQLIESIVEGK